MTAKCAFCSTPITSLDIDTKRAIREIGNTLSAHLITCHREEVTKLQNITSINIMAITWFILFTLAAKTPESETELINQIEKTRGDIAAMLGVEIVGTKEECEIVDVTNNVNKDNVNKDKGDKSDKVTQEKTLAS